MNATEILKALIKSVDEGVEACDQRPNAVTPNHALGSMLNHIRNAAVLAVHEIEKGNAE
jgi:hypothetical protein